MSSAHGSCAWVLRMGPAHELCAWVLRMGPAHGSCAWVLRRALSAGADIPVLGGGAESALAGELLERLIREAVSRPFVLGYRSEAAVEADRGLVPVKHGPF